MEPPPTRTLDRTMSLHSRQAVDNIGKLRERLEELKSRVQEASEIASAEHSTIEDLHRVKQEFAQMIGVLDKFQFNEVDAVVTHNLNSGKDEVRRQRKDLTRVVTALGEEARRQHEAIAARIKSV